MEKKNFEEMRLENAKKLLTETFDDIVLAMSLQDKIMTDHFIKKLKYRADYYLYERDKNNLN